MFLCSKLLWIGLRSANFLLVFFQKCLLDQHKHTRSSTKISMGTTYHIIIFGGKWWFSCHYIFFRINVGIFLSKPLSLCILHFLLRRFCRNYNISPLWIQTGSERVSFKKSGLRLGLRQNFQSLMPIWRIRVTCAAIPRLPPTFGCRANSGRTKFRPKPCPTWPGGWSTWTASRRRKPEPEILTKGYYINNANRRFEAR
jgi:hypothetical protein